MPAHSDQPDEFEPPWDDEDRDAPQERDLTDSDDETPTVPCPSCRREIPDCADRCPYCGDWVVQSSGTPARHRLGFVLLVLIAILLILVVWVLGRR
jgi:hypothetical protein